MKNKKNSNHITESKKVLINFIMDEIGIDKRYIKNTLNKKLSHHDLTCLSLEILNK